MTKDIVGKRYARALIGSIEKKEDFDKVGEQLKEISLVFKESKELQNFFFNPAIPFNKKEMVLVEILNLYQLHPSFKKILFLLLKNDWLKIIYTIYAYFILYCDQYNNRVRAEVTSAYELTDDERTGIVKKLRDYTGKEVVLNTKIDPEIIGGVIARIGSLVIDGSVRNYLKMIKDSLTKDIQ